MYKVIVALGNGYIPIYKSIDFENSLLLETALKILIKQHIL
jgi:hypothetical protein